MTSHLDYLKDLFAPCGEISVRKMFGGAGVYCDGKIFAISGTDEDLWLKADDVTRDEFEAEGLSPFEFEMKGKIGTMSYYAPPDDYYDEEDVFRHWTQLALGAAARARKPVKKPATKKAKVKKAARQGRDT